MSRRFQSRPPGGVPGRLRFFCIVGLLALSMTLGCESAGSGLSITEVTGEDAKNLVKESGARVVLINVWATWCAPCVEEFPDIVRLYRTYRDRGLDLILISADFHGTTKVEDFLKKQGVDFPTYLKTGKDEDFMESLEPQWNGAIPLTILFDSSGNRTEFWERQVTYDELAGKIEDLL